MLWRQRLRHGSVASAFELRYVESKAEQRERTQKLQLFACICFVLKNAMRDSFFHLYVGRVVFSASRPSNDSLCLHGRRQTTTPKYIFLRAFSKTARVVDLENALLELYFGPGAARQACKDAQCGLMIEGRYFVILPYFSLR